MNRLTLTLTLTLTLGLPLALFACGADEDDGGDDSGDTGDLGPGASTPDAFSNCRSADGDATDLAEAALSLDTLTLVASYSGGCEAHEFQICWDQDFAESAPVQIWLEVWHDANGDACEAIDTQTLSFDLTPLKQAWQDAYQQSSGEITVHTDGGTVAYTF